MIIAFDFARLTTPYRLKRCSWQMMHMALAAEHLGHEVRAIINDGYLEKHPFLSTIKHLWSTKTDCDVYIGKGDAFYKDSNWEQIKHHNFKVCLCNSDRNFRESSKPHRRHRGNPVQDRCDIYMPVNHTANLHLKKNVHPVAHPIDPRMVIMLMNRQLYMSYIKDDVQTIRSEFKVAEIGRAGFFGSPNPESRRGTAWCLPHWVDFKWDRARSSREYVNWMMERRGCVDLRGNGDKSLRFTEAALLGRTIITVRRISKYAPDTVNNHNCILGDSWKSLNLEFDKKKWLELSDNATHDYLNGWSVLSQVRKITELAK